MTTTQTKLSGWNGTYVGKGMMCHLRKAGFGRGCMVEIEKAGTMCDVKIIHVGKNGAGWKTGDRLSVCVAWLEGVQ
jgi:hypothetical protein